MHRLNLFDSCCEEKIFCTPRGRKDKLAYTLKRLLVGKAKKTSQALHERLTKKTGLAVFASDALSSTGLVVPGSMVQYAIRTTVSDPAKVEKELKALNNVQ